MVKEPTDGPEKKPEDSQPNVTKPARRDVVRPGQVQPIIKMNEERAHVTHDEKPKSKQDENKRDR